MREHLAFLRRYKDILRLKLNATEDLLVNGQREPRERGVCRHLLGKLDRTVIERAVEREPLRSDAALRARMLAGAIRVTADVGVLLDYLEALAHVRSREEAAQAFAEVVRRLDFASLSATRLARLLQVLLETFADHERVQVVLGLLAAPTFSRAFDAAAASFPAQVTEAFAPLRAVHRSLTGDDAAADPPALVAAGMEQVLGAPDPLLRGYAEPLRVGLLDLALAPAAPAALADRAAAVLLPSLPRSGRTYARLAIRRAARLLARHADDRARAILEELCRAQPGLRTAERWLAALDARRMGRIALGAEPPERGRLAVAFWLDGQRPVWLRTAAVDAAERLAAEAHLQHGLALPGVAPVVEHGVAMGIPYVAVSGAGRPLAFHALEARTAFGLAAAAARVLRAVALAGVVLPDAEPERFLYEPGPAMPLVLADLDGAAASDPASAGSRHAALAVAFARRIVDEGALSGLEPDTREAVERALAEPAGLVELTAVLDCAAAKTIPVGSRGA